jgi:DNA-binding Xre family transcriptional regulator
MKHVSRQPQANVTPTPVPNSRVMLAYVREMRYDRGISLTELAERVELSPAILAGALWGETELSSTRVAQLVQALELEPHELVAEPARGGLLSPGEAPWSGRDEAWASQTGWPTVVAKEGSD